MCTKGSNGKELTLPQIMERLESKKVARRVIYSKQEVKSARAVLDRLVSFPSTSHDTTSVHHLSYKVRG